MALKIRLRKQGRTNRPFYRVVVANTLSPRDGKYVESVGWYNPVNRDEDQVLSLDIDRVQFWIDQGAELTEKAKALVNKAAPEVVRKLTEKQVAHRAKAAAKRKARKKEAV